MGACATKPKVLKDADEKPVAPLPEPLPHKEEEAAAEVKVVQREPENDSPLAPIESPTKNPSLGNLFKESEDAKVSPSTESENENAVNSSRESEAIKALEVARGNAEALEILPAPSATVVDAPVEKEAIKAPEIIAKEDTEALPAPATTVDAPVEKNANKASEKLPTVATRINASIEKMDSQASDYVDALPAPASPVVADAPAEKLAVSAPPEPEIVHKENADASEDVEEIVGGQKTDAESLEKIPTPPPATEFSEEYTDAIADSDAPTGKVAIGTDGVVNDDTNASHVIIEQTEVEKLKQTEDAKLIQVTSTEEEIPPLNIADKKTVEENAVPVEVNQIEVAESINPSTQESDIKQS